MKTLDKRVENGQREKELFSCSKLSDQKLADNIACYFLRDRTRRGATGKCDNFGTSERYGETHETARNNTMYKQKLINVVQGLVEPPDIPRKRWECIILALGTTLPLLWRRRDIKVSAMLFVAASVAMMS